MKKKNKNTDEHGNYKCPNPKCGLLTPDPMYVETPQFSHKGKYCCPLCGSCIYWALKTEKPVNREGKHRDLVAKYSNGFCEMCLGTISNLGDHNALAAHHVIEYQDGGSHDRSNIWILCTHCHTIVHTMRKIRESVTGGLKSAEVSTA